MINNLPNGWEIGFLNDKKTNEIKGSGIDKFDGNKNYLSTESIKNNKINSIEEIITYEKRPSRANLQPNFNDVFFAKMKDTEKVLKITEETEEDYILSTGFMPIKPYIDKLNSDFLAHYFKSETFNLQKDRLSNGGTQKALNNGNAEKISIPIPPIQQQKRIVKVLDLTLILIEKQNQLIKKYDLFLKSKFNEIFGCPVLNPLKWKKIKLEEVIDFLTSGSRGWAKYYSNKGEIFIRIQNVKNGKINFTDNQYVNAPNTQESVRTKVRENDLLLSITADLGRTGVVSKELANFGAYINQHLALIRLKKEFSPIYASYFIESIEGRTQFDKFNQGGTKSGLNFNSIKAFEILNPPYELQNKFALIVEKIEVIKEKENQKLKQLEDLHNSMMNKAFKGEIL